MSPRAPLPASRSAIARRSWPRRPRSACCQRYPCAAAERAAVSQRYRLRIQRDFESSGSPPSFALKAPPPMKSMLVQPAAIARCITVQVISSVARYQR